MECFRQVALAGIGLAALGVCLPVNAVAQEAADPVTAIQAGAPIVELRARYEGVEQAGRPDDAEALTLRSRLGWQTAKWSGLQALVEFEDVRPLADDRYDSALNGRTTYAQVFDPEVTELNRAQLVWTPSKDYTLTLGRESATHANAPGSLRDVGDRSIQIAQCCRNRRRSFVDNGCSGGWKS